MTRSELHQLVDRLPEETVEPLGNLMQRAIEDPFAAILAAAPIDDEPLTPEDEAAITAGVEAVRRGETIPWEQAKQELAADD